MFACLRKYVSFCEQFDGTFWFGNSIIFSVMVFNAKGTLMQISTSPYIFQFM